MLLTNNQLVFFALIQAGLWGKDVQLASFDDTIYFKEVYRLAENQLVIGLVAAGLEHVVDIKLPKKDVLQFVGQALQLEQRNAAMNAFIADIVEKMQSHDINTLLVKGQGIAQCYERPLWRASGDVDFCLSQENYLKAKEYLLSLSAGNKPEKNYSKELGMIIDPWYVEIHGSLRTGLSTRIDKVIDEVLDDVFRNGCVRTWMNDKTRVFLPAPDHDVFLVFTHFIKHFYKEGVALRQICDWVRLLWTYRGEINVSRIESWVRRASLEDEWRVFASVAVDWLEMPEAMMPLYDARCRSKASRLVDCILEGYSGSRVKNALKIASIFPWKTLCYLPGIFLNINSLKVAERLLGR